METNGHLKDLSWLEEYKEGEEDRELRNRMIFKKKKNLRRLACWLLYKFLIMGKKEITTTDVVKSTKILDKEKELTKSYAKQLLDSLESMGLIKSERRRRIHYFSLVKQEGGKTLEIQNYTDVLKERGDSK